MKDCIFCKIASGEIPAEKLYEDGDMVIIRDIAPQAKLHYLLIPKRHFADIVEMSTEESLIMAKCVKKLASLTDNLGLSEGFRLVSNKGKNGRQSVGHLHLHILGGELLSDKMG